MAVWLFGCMITVIIHATIATMSTSLACIASYFQVTNASCTCTLLRDIVKERMMLKFFTIFWEQHILSFRPHPPICTSFSFPLPNSLTPLLFPFFFPFFGSENPNQSLRNLETDFLCVSLLSVPPAFSVFLLSLFLFFASFLSVISWIKLYEAEIKSFVS